MQFQQKVITRQIGLGATEVPNLPSGPLPVFLIVDAVSADDIVLVEGGFLLGSQKRRVEGSRKAPRTLKTPT